VPPPVEKPVPAPKPLEPPITVTPQPVPPAPGECGTAPDRPSCLAQDLAAKIVGLPEADAQATVSGAGVAWRVVARDGEGLAVTDDWSGNRVNVKIEDGKVASASVF